MFAPHAPSTIRVFGSQGQPSPAQLIDRYAITCRPVRDVLVAYLTERQPMLDHTTLIDLASSLGGLFWRDLERHHPGICSFTLPREVAAAWKQRVLTKTRRVTGPDGRREVQRTTRRWTAQSGRRPCVLPRHRPVGDEDPARWAPWAAPCPIRAEDLARQKEIRSRKSRTDQRTRERLPVLPALVSRVNAARTTTADRLGGRAGHHTRRVVPGRRRHIAPHRHLHPRHRPDLGRRPRHRQAPRPVRRGGPGVLDLGRGRDVAPHRHLLRGSALRWRFVLRVCAAQRLMGGRYRVQQVWRKPTWDGSPVAV